MRLALPVPRHAFCVYRFFIDRKYMEASIEVARPNVNSDKWFFAQEDKWGCWQRSFYTNGDLFMNEDVIWGNKLLKKLHSVPLKKVYFIVSIFCTAVFL